MKKQLTDPMILPNINNITVAQVQFLYEYLEELEKGYPEIFNIKEVKNK